MAISCGRKESCGGMFSSCPGDSEWDICEAHRADLPQFEELYKARVASAIGAETVTFVCLEESG